MTSLPVFKRLHIGRHGLVNKPTKTNTPSLTSRPIPWTLICIGLIALGCIELCGPASTKNVLYLNWVLIFYAALSIWARSDIR